MQNNGYMKAIAWVTLGLTIGVLTTTIWLNHIEIKEHLKPSDSPKNV